MAQYEAFIPENIALPNTRRIGIYNSKGNRVGFIALGNLTPPNMGQKLYSFGALSDIHLQDDTAQADFQRALTYLNETEDVEFICVPGDLTQNGNASEFAEYKSCVDAYSPNTPVYSSTGNHDTWSGLAASVSDYLGFPLYYSFTHGNDIFIMVGLVSDAEVFTQEELQWLYETLELNRNKRCFVFQHALRFDGCGNPYAGVSPTYDVLSCHQNGKIFTSLVSHYNNVIWFHGHSHTAFDSQVDNDIANYDKLYGIHSVHIPSLAVPREYEDSAYVAKYTESEGYVVDVYENGIHLRGRDFVKGEFLPIASYWLDTTLQTVEAGTYVDSTGTITV